MKSQWNDESTINAMAIYLEKMKNMARPSTQKRQTMCIEIHLSYFFESTFPDLVRLAFVCFHPKPRIRVPPSLLATFALTNQAKLRQQLLQTSTLVDCASLNLLRLTKSNDVSFVLYFLVVFAFLFLACFFFCLGTFICCQVKCCRWVLQCGSHVCCAFDRIVIKYCARSEVDDSWCCWGDRTGSKIEHYKRWTHVWWSDQQQLASIYQQV